MKKGILSIAALAFVLLISFSSLSVKPAATATEKPSAPAVSGKDFECALSQYA